MHPKKQILKFIQQEYENLSKKEAGSETEATTGSDRVALKELFDGMSTGTARIIIEEEITEKVADAFNIDSLENQGRYYAARVILADGATIRLLVDKQTGAVQLIGG